MMNANIKTLTARYYHTATSIGSGQIVVIGGFNSYSGLLSDVWVLKMNSLSSGNYLIFMS